MAVAPTAPAEDSDHWRIKSAVRGSDLVALGTVTRMDAALTPKHGFVVTDAEFVVEEVWKASGAVAGLRPGGEVTVARLGGTVSVDGHTITARISFLQPFQVGHRYLLFLTYVPAARSFEPVSPVGFDVSGPTVVPLQTNVVPAGKQYFENMPSFLGAMRSSTERAAAGSLREGQK